MNNTYDLNLTVDNLQADVTLRLYDTNFNQFGSSTNTGTEAESISTILGAGAYFIEISGFEKTTYDLNVQATEIPDQGNNFTGDGPSTIDILSAPNGFSLSDHLNPV